mgnify:CR=1 FL=1
MGNFTFIRAASRLAIPIWAAALLLVSASLMVGHWVNLPHPEIGQDFEYASQVSNVAHSDRQVFAFHFLYGDCPCSRRVLKHVMKRMPVDGAVERVVLIGEDKAMEDLALTQGYQVDVVTPIELKEKYGVESAPLLIVTNNAGEIKYSGGYTSRKRGLDIQDHQIIQDTLEGNEVAGLPLYGCAVSKSLKAIVDPLNIKY